MGKSGSGVICSGTGTSGGSAKRAKAVCTASPPTPCMGVNTTRWGMEAFSARLEEEGRGGRGEGGRGGGREGEGEGEGGGGRE